MDAHRLGGLPRARLLMRLAHQSVRLRALRDCVDLLWLAEGYQPPHAAERLLPTGSLDLVLSLDEGRPGEGRPGAGSVSGAHSHFSILDTTRPLSLIGVRFKPGGGFPFLGLPAGELQDSRVSADLLWGRQASLLREQLLEAQLPVQRFAVLERFLLQRLRHAPARDPAVRFAVEAFKSSSARMPSVAAVVDRIGSSPRRFIAAFRDEVGLTPKVFCRISRFRRAIDTLQSAVSVDWSALALECGYFDQAHFIHDFRAFAGVSPSAYLRDRTSANHVRVAE